MQGNGSGGNEMQDKVRQGKAMECKGGVGKERHRRQAKAYEGDVRGMGMQVKEREGKGMRGKAIDGKARQGTGREEKAREGNVILHGTASISD
jgi:hypothetical protein